MCSWVKLLSVYAVKLRCQLLIEGALTEGTAVPLILRNITGEIKYGGSFGFSRFVRFGNRKCIALKLMDFSLEY